MSWNVYLSGEIHTDWRDQIANGAKALDLQIEFTSAVANHAASDAAGDLLGEETSNFWRDHKSSKVNAIRTRTLIENCDLGIVTDRNYNRVFDAELIVCTTRVSHSKVLVCSDTRLSHAQVSDSRAVAQAIV